MIEQPARSTVELKNQALAPRFAKLLICSHSDG